MSSNTAKQIMDVYLKSECRDRDRLNRPESQARINENMRKAQIEMINSHYPDMDDVTKARARITLRQIGGCVVDDSHGTFVIEV